MGLHVWVDRCSHTRAKKNAYTEVYYRQMKNKKNQSNKNRNQIEVLFFPIIDSDLLIAYIICEPDGTQTRVLWHSIRHS